MDKKELEGLNVPELKKIADSKGIAGFNSMNKAKLIEAILGPEKNEDKEEIPLHKIPGKYLKLKDL